MKILLAQKLPYLPALSGASKANKMLLEALARRGHTCCVLASKDASDEAWSGNTILSSNGVEVHSVADGVRFAHYLTEQIREFDPDSVLISEDPTYLLLSAAIEAARERTTFLACSQTTLPFGPEAFSPNEAQTKLLGKAAGIVTVSRYLQNYIQRWAGLNSWWTPLPLYGDGPFRALASFDHPYVTMVNPSAIKGLSIFSKLVQALPEILFAAVPTWATTTVDKMHLETFSNVRLLPPDENIDAIFAQTRVLIIPSLWGEAFGMVAVEAMLRAIPVLASDVGGLPEAKLGVDYVLPVKPISHYKNRRDEKFLKVPIIPDQDIGPWVNALRELLSDRNRYEQISTRSRNAALAYVSSLSISPFETYLETIYRSSQQGTKNPTQTTDVDEFSKRIAALTPARRSLLERALKDRKKPEFPAPQGERKFTYLVKLQSGRGPTSIFCIPFSGGFKNEVLSFASLAPLVGQHYSFYCLFARGTDGKSPPHGSVQEMAAAYIEEIKIVQPSGPYFILGECFSASLAYEMAQQLASNGEPIGLLAFLDALAYRSLWNRFLGNRLGGYIRYHVVCFLQLPVWNYVKTHAPFHYRQLKNRPSQGRLRYLLRIMRKFVGVIPTAARRAKSSEAAPASPRYRTPPRSRHLKRAHKAYGLAIRRYERKTYMGAITVIATEEKCKSDPNLGWVANGGVEVHKIPGNHVTYLRDHLYLVADLLRTGIQRGEKQQLTEDSAAPPILAQS
jgi:glycosyltransferase involved in cell wall biosynthesis